jgi:glutathione S-transferase
MALFAQASLQWLYVFVCVGCSYIPLQPPMSTTPRTQLYINNVCPYAHRAYIAALEKGAVQSGAIEIVEVSLPTPEWYNKEVNPRHKVPALKLPDGRSVPESLVVVQYIDETFPGPSLTPADAKDRADARVFVGDLDAFNVGLYKLLVEKDAVKREELAKSTAEDVAYLEKALAAKSAGPFFLGETFSFVDIAIIPFLDRYRYTLQEYAGVDLLANAPRLRALLAAAEQRESFKASAQSKEFYLNYVKQRLQ